MIELKLTIADSAALLNVAKALAAIDGVTTEPLAPGIATTLSPGAQQAARDSTAPGKAAKAEKASKAAAPAPAPEPSPPPAETKLPTYEESGVAPLITKAQVKNVEAVKALLRELGAVTAEGKIKGSAMPAANFAVAIEKLQAIIDAPESME